MASEERIDISIVAPVYAEERNISEFLRRIQAALAGVTEQYELIFALDPSPDATEKMLRDARSRDRRIKLLKFSRRFGQPMAIIAGLEKSRGRAVIVMDADLQDPPELIPEMVARWKDGFDVVLTRRKSRTGETFLKRFVSFAGYALIERFSDPRIPPNTGDFRLMSRTVVDHVIGLKESHGFLRGLTAFVGFRQVSIDFDRPARYAGIGNYNRFLGSLRIGMHGVVGFSNAALKLSWIGGIGATGLGIVLAVAGLVTVLTSDVPYLYGWIAALVLFVAGMQFMAVGILGEYIGRIYDEVRERPKYIIDEAIGFDRESEHS